MGKVLSMSEKNPPIVQISNVNKRFFIDLLLFCHLFTTNINALRALFFNYDAKLFSFFSNFDHQKAEKFGNVSFCVLQLK